MLLKEGTEIKLKCHDTITSKTAVELDLVNLILDRDLKVGEGSYGGESRIGRSRNLSYASKAGMLGRPGDLGLRLEYLKVDDSSVRLRGTNGKQRKRKERDGGSTHGSFGPVGLIKHGHNAVFKQATPRVVYVDRDTELPTLR